MNIFTNFATHEPIQKVTRKVKRKPKASFDMPMLIKTYIQGMGGVDIMNRLLSANRPGVRGKKWYWPLITNALNISVVAAWRLHCALAVKPMSHITFRREVTLCLLKHRLITTAHKVTEGRCPGLPATLRCDGVSHVKIGLPYFEKQKSGHWMTNFHETKFMAPPTFFLSKAGR